MSDLSPRHGVAIVALLAAATSCDALIGLGDEPSGGAPTSSSTGDASSGSTTSSSTSASTSTSGGEGGGSGIASSVSAGPGGAGGTGGAGGAGGGDGGGPVGMPCGSCDAPCDACDGDRCILRTWPVPETDRVGDSSDTTINRFGRGFVVTGVWIAFQRRIAGVGPVVTLIRRADGARLDLGGFVETASIAGIAASGDEQVIAVVEHVANFTAIHRIVLDPVTPTIENVTPAANVGPLGVVAALGPEREFLAANRYDSTLVRFDLAAQDPFACLVATSAAPTAPIDLDLVGGGSEVQVGILQYQLSQAQRFDGDPSCVGKDVLMETVTLPHDVQALAGAQLPGRTFVLGFGTGGAPVVVNDELATLPTIASLALDATVDGVFFPDPSGGLQRCGHDLAADECATIIPPDAIDQVGQVRAMPWGAYAVGMRDGNTAAVACVDTRE